MFALQPQNESVLCAYFLAVSHSRSTIAPVLALLTHLLPACRISGIFEDRSISESLTRTKYTYDAFGKLTASTGTLTNPFRYTAREFDPETGVYEYRARYYDQSLGRFLSEDPVGFSSETYNLYDYVSGDPVDYNDPSGNKKIYANWCGPNWTGGREESYILSHDGGLPNGVPYYLRPVDYVDKVCSHHDKCYSKCKRNHPCTPFSRAFCEKKCDVFLIGRIVGNPKDIYRPRAYEIGVGIGGWVLIPWPGPNGGEDKNHPIPCGCK